MNFLNLFFKKKSKPDTEKRQIKYLTLNGFEMRMSIKGHKQFERDNNERLTELYNQWDNNKERYYKTKRIADTVIVFVGKDYDTKCLRKYVEKNYFSISSFE